MRPLHVLGLSLGCALLLPGIYFLGYLVDRTAFWEVLGGFTLAFSGYFLVIAAQERHPNKSPDLLKWLIALGVLLRCGLLFAPSLLSDDIFRFLWDGYLINAGISPFAELPAHYLNAENEVPGLTAKLYAKLNSPEYYTIYPPLAQLVFTFATGIAGNNWWLGSILMKLVLLIAELGTLTLLYRMLPHWKVPRSSLLLYWLNPLILIEIMGNLHFEGLMIVFLVLALWALYRARIVTAALAFAAAVAAKLLPLLLLPFLIVRLWRREAGGSRPFWTFSLVFGGSLLLFFAPLFDADFFANFGSSLDLYFRKFEFNASIYYLFRAYGYYEIGWNQIARFGPLLGQLSAVLILAFAAIEGWRARRHYELLPELYRTLPVAWLFAFTLYLLLSTTIHPWYLSLPIVLCCFGRWRFPIVWSFFIVLTYASYTTVPYQENYWLVGLEYLSVLGYLIYEWRRKPKRVITAGL